MKIKTFRALNVFSTFFIIIGFIILFLVLKINSFIGALLILYFPIFCFWEAFVPKIILYNDKITIYYLKSRGNRDPRLRKLIKKDFYFSDIRHFQVNKGFFYRSVEISLARNGKHVISTLTYSPYMMNSFLNIMSKKSGKITDNSVKYDYYSFKDFLISGLFFILFSIITFVVPILLIYYIDIGHHFFILTHYQYFYLCIFFLAGLLLFLGIYAIYYNRKDIRSNLITSLKHEKYDLNIKKLILISILFYIIALILLLIDILLI